MKLRDLFSLSTESVKPQSSIVYSLYSLPAFDVSSKPEKMLGKDIMSNKYVVPHRCILFNKLNARFKRVWIVNNNDPNKIASTEFLPLVVNEDLVDFNYAYFILISDSLTDYLCGQNSNTSGSHKRIDPQNFLNIEIILPAREEQEKIGNFLSNINKKIIVNQEINRNLEVLARQLYDYWFVQFDFPDENGNPYKSSGGKMVWNQKLKREIPEGWEVRRIKDITEVLLGGTPDTSNEDFWNGRIPWLNSGEVAEFPILLSEKTITEIGLSQSTTVFAPKGSVTLSITRHLRPSILAIDACINQSVVAIKETNLFHYSFLYPYLLNEIPRLMALRTGAQQPHINKETVEESYMLFITPELLRIYYSKVESIYESIILNAKGIHSLLEQRKRLLPLLMNGQVSIKPTEIN